MNLEYKKLLLFNLLSLNETIVTKLLSASLKKLSMDAITSKLAHHLASVPARIKAIPENELHGQPAPGKWSKKEIMGHLIDSALYNLMRFSQAQYKPLPYVVEGYAQDDLVHINDYQNLPLTSILDTWQALNKH